MDLKEPEKEGAWLWPNESWLLSQCPRHILPFLSFLFFLPRPPFALSLSSFSIIYNTYITSANVAPTITHFTSKKEGHLGIGCSGHFGIGAYWRDAKEGGGLCLAVCERMNPFLGAGKGRRPRCRKSPTLFREASRVTISTQTFCWPDHLIDKFLVSQKKSRK